MKHPLVWGLFARADDALVVTFGFGIFGYWSVGELEIVRIAWGALSLVRVGSVYGLSVFGFAIGDLDLRREASA